MFEHGGIAQSSVFSRRGDIIDFSANVNSLGVPRWMGKVLKENISCIANYPDPESRELRLSLGKYLGVDENCVAVGNGSAELIYQIVAAIKPKTAVLLSPTFSEYEKALQGHGSKVSFVRLSEENGFEVDLGKVAREARDKDLVFLCNPNNPTGRLIPSARMIPWIKSFKRTKTFIVIDEAFIDWEPGESIAGLVKESTRLVVLRSLTKFFGLAGLRLGYCVMSPALASRMKNIRQPWSVNIFAQKVGKRILEDRDFQKKNRAFLKKERDFLASQFDRFDGLKAYPSSVNFLLLKVDSVDVSRSMQKYLLERGIFVRDCGNFRELDSRFVRVSVLKRKENLCLLEGISSFLERTRT